MQGQDPAMKLEFTKDDIHVNRLLAKKPLTLAKTLTKDKHSDKEKFDAIFAWVASNIRYDFATYFSSGGSGLPRVKKILKYKTGICMDYAYLMDTLCKLSGITNASVYGYAKDDIFDVQDSLYLDNHAWNAVQLDGKWYVYDVTWASGQPEYRFTKFSNFIYQLYLKHPPKYRIKKRLVRNIFSVDYCDSATVSAAVEVNFYKQKFWNKFLREQLLKFRLKVKRYGTQKINPQYYLCNPELFAITHFPDDPAWSLVAKKAVREFEGDSAFYHWNDTLLNAQMRYGKPCPDCDAFLGYDELQKQITLRKESLKFNRRNRFVTTTCEYAIGKLKLGESKNFDDSLTKVTILDTSLAYVDFAKASLYQSFLNIEQDHYLQRIKNSSKSQLLYNENNAYIIFVLNQRFRVKTEAKSFKDLERKTHAMQQKLKRRIHHISDYKDHQVPNDKVKNTEIKLRELDQKLRNADSLIALHDRKIDSLKLLFELKTQVLSVNMKEKTVEHDSVFSYFNASIRLRYYMRDNYKKDVVEVRKKIELSKNDYMSDMEEKIYQPSAECALLGEALFKTIIERNVEEENAFVLKAELVRRGQIRPDELSAYKALLKRKNREDLCWLKRREPDLYALFSMFKQFINRQRDAMGIIKAENWVEAGRERYINKELGRRKRKYKKIILHNTKVVNYQLRETRKEKRLFLKKLRDERREAARK
jgi:hypothetical protein